MQNKLNVVMPIIALAIFFGIFAFIFIDLIVSSLKNKLKTAVNRRAGKIGEEIVGRRLELLCTTNCRLINDVVLYDENRKTFQIDHIFINSRGIWIIETKNWSGFVRGDEMNNDWFQKRKNRFERRYNPIQQNWVHCDKIQRLLGKYTPINCLVVFVKANISSIKSNYICNLKDLTSVLFRNTGKHLTNFEIEQYYKKILFLKNKCNISSEEHEEIITNYRNRYSAGFCPKCNGRLVRRKSKNGDFYGCDNYPRCKFTKRIREFFS